MLAVLGWCHSGATLEVAVEMLAALESQSVGHLGDGVVGRVQIFFGDVNNLVLDELHRCFAGLFFHEVSEVVGRQAALVGKNLDRWQPVHED